MCVSHSSFLVAVVRCTLAIAAVLCLAKSRTWAVAPSTTVIALTGDPAPDGNGRFSTFERPVLNDIGQVAFRANLSGAIGGDQGIFRGDGTTLIQIARRGQVAPDGNGILNTVSPSTLNNLGQVDGIATNASGGLTDNLAILRGDGASLVQIARKGQTAPGGDGRLSNFNGLSLNDSGQIAYSATLTETIEGDDSNVGIFRSDGTNSAQVFREGQLMPDGNGRLADPLSLAAINNSGQVASAWQLRATAAGITDSLAILLSDDTSLVQIARRSQSLPHGDGVFAHFYLTTQFLNDRGEVVFLADVADSVGEIGYGSDRGIFRGDGTSLVQLARIGQAAPDGNGTFSSLGSLDRPAWNNSSEIAFIANLDDTAGGPSDDLGIFRSDGTSLIQVVRRGQAAPDGNGMFATFVEPTINDTGQVAFLAALAETSGDFDDRGIFFFDESMGVMQVARTGDALLGGTINSLNMICCGRGGGTAVRSADLSDAGTPRIAYQFGLVDGRTGIALWTLVPEPGSLVLVGVGTLLIGIVVAWPARRQPRP